MAEYIKRDKLLRDINHYHLSDGKFQHWVEVQPAADVAPVRHGRWVPFHSTAAGDIQYCSACEIGCTWKPNYCPNCGAKMDGDDGD